MTKTVMKADKKKTNGKHTEVVVFWIVTPCNDVVGYHHSH